jgi:hypothetical protein
VVVGVVVVCFLLVVGFLVMLLVEITAFASAIDPRASNPSSTVDVRNLIFFVVVVVE